MSNQARSLVDRARAAWRARQGPTHVVLLLACTAIVAVLAIAQLALLAFVRLRYPFALEWMEGGIVDHVRVVLSGAALYREPSLGFTPYIYPPLYYYVSAVVSRLVGIGLLAPRLVSVVSMFGSVVLVGRFVFRETRHRIAAIVAAGLFAATFPLSGAWMDIARVDSLFVFLVLGAAYVARSGRSLPSGAASGVLLSLAVFTKQTGLSLAVPVLAAALLCSRRRGAIATASFVVLTGAGVLVMNRLSGNWFGFYVFDVPSQHEMRWGEWRPLADALWTPCVMPVMLGLVAFASLLRRSRREAASSEGAPHERWPLAVLYAGLLVTAALSSYSSLLHADGFANVLMPYHAIVSLSAGLGLGWLFRREHTEAPVSSALGVVQGAVVVALLLHFGMSLYDHRPMLPTRRDVEAGQNMIDALRRRPGPVLMLGSGFYASMAGHEEIHAHTMALVDVFKTHEAARKNALRDSIVDEIRARRFATIVMDPSVAWLPPPIKQQVEATYRLEGPVFPASDVASTYPRTGFHTRPEEFWVPR